MILEGTAAQRNLPAHVPALKPLGMSLTELVRNEVAEFACRPRVARLLVQLRIFFQALEFWFDRLDLAAADGENQRVGFALLEPDRGVRARELPVHREGVRHPVGLN